MTMKLRILFVDDEPHLREFMRTELPRLGHEVTVCPDAQAAARDVAKSHVRRRHPRPADGTATRPASRCSQHLKQVSPDTEAVIMTGYASQETAIDALRLGAFDYITKPCKLAEIEGLLLRIVEKTRS